MLEAIISLGCLLYFVFFDHDPNWLVASGLFAIAVNISQLKEDE